MSKKKNKTVVTDKASVQADLTNLIDAAKTSLFELDSSYSFIEAQNLGEEVPLAAQNEAQTLNEQNFSGQSIEEQKRDHQVDEELGEELSEELDEVQGKELDEELGEEVPQLAFATTADTDTDIEAKTDIESEIEPDIEDETEADSVTEISAQAEVSSAEDDFNLLEAAFQNLAAEPAAPAPVLEGTELDSFESAQIEELEFITEEQLQSVVESILFATDRPVSLATIKLVFVGTNVSNARIKTAIENLKSYYANSKSGVTLEDIGSGFQLRTKLDNMEFLRRSLKARPFKLSGPALEVLAIVAYKQPIIKSEIDEIRGVESGHLLRALMEKNLCTFGGKSDLPGKPMLYETTRKFLEIFSLRNLKELPTLSQIDELLPEGIGDEADEKPKLHDITEGLSQQVGDTYSESEEELHKITGQLEEIQTSSDFFEQEKQRQKMQKDADKAQNIRDALAVGEVVSTRDANWLKRYDEQKLAAESGETPAPVEVAEEDSFKPETTYANDDDEFNELNMALDRVDEEDSLIDPEVLEANDIADIEA